MISQTGAVFRKSSLPHRAHQAFQTFTSRDDKSIIVQRQAGPGSSFLINMLTEGKMNVKKKKKGAGGTCQNYPKVPLFHIQFLYQTKCLTSECVISVNSVSVQTVGNPNGSSPYCHGNASGSTFSGSGINAGRKTCARVITKETDHRTMDASIPQTHGANSEHQHWCNMLTCNSSLQETATT